MSLKDKARTEHPSVPTSRRGLPMDEWQLAYDAENPHLYEAFEATAFKMLNHGYRHLSARHIIHVMRYETALAAHNDVFKISDHITPYYARKFEKRNPQHAGVFRKKAGARTALK